MNKNGIKIKNIKAGTLYGVNSGTRNYYDSKDGVLSYSLFSLFLEKNGMKTYNEKSTRDLICLDFDFGSRSYEDEISRLKEKKAELESAEEKDEYKLKFFEELIKKTEDNKDNYVKLSKEEIREKFYEEDVSVTYESKNKKGEIRLDENGNPRVETIEYKMLYRTTAKAKLGQAMFINKKLYKKAYNWLTMDLGRKMPNGEALIVEMSAYAPLTTSTIVDTINIPVEDILILKDQDSFFTAMANVVEAVEVDGQKICTVNKKETNVKNTVWDGMGIIEDGIFPDWANGMMLLRNHFFKMCGFRGKLQLFIKEYCEQNGIDYDTFEIEDMFGVKHLAKNLKIVTTDNAIKWKKFMNLMGKTPVDAYNYWCEKIRADNCMFGVVKTDHKSKLGDVQQMSYQMINTLPCTREELKNIVKTSIDYVESLKFDNDEFEKFLRREANEMNHYEMLADLYVWNKKFAESKWFRNEKVEIIKSYVKKLRKGKITLNADNLTVCGNPYALLLYAVGEDWTKDTTFNKEDGTVQCYTTRFKDGEYLCAFRNPHNSPNNVCYLHNHYSDLMEKFFPFSENIIAVNMIETDIQDRANGMDEDSDFLFVTNNEAAVTCAKRCYEEFHTIVNNLKESGIKYQNTRKAYSDMDNKLAKSKTGIGQSSNMAQNAMSYYWDNVAKNGDLEEREILYDNFVILSVLAQIIIDNCKRGYEIDALNEIKRIKSMPCMQRGLPEFMRYTKDIKCTNGNGEMLPQEEINSSKDKLEEKIEKGIICPMNWLEEELSNIKGNSRTNTTDTREFFVKIEGKANYKQMSKIRELVEEYDGFVKNSIMENKAVTKEEQFEISEAIKEKSNELIDSLRKIKISNNVTINRIIEVALDLEKENNNINVKNITNGKNTRKLLNILYKMDAERFLSNFIKG